MVQSGNLSPSLNLLPIISSRDYRQAPDGLEEQPIKLVSPVGLGKLQPQRRQLLSPRGTLASLRNNPASIYLKNQHFKASPLASPSPQELRHLSPDCAKTINPTLQHHPGLPLSQGGISPTRRNDSEMNSDLQMLMQVPKQQKNGRNKLDPLKLPASLTASIDSSESQLKSFNNRQSFNYPPDIRTAKLMILEANTNSQSVATKGSTVQITDYNFQCAQEGRSPSHTTILDRKIEHDQLGVNVRAHVQQIMAAYNSENYFDYQVGSEELRTNPEIQMTVKNENLFSMMQQSLSRGQQKKQQQQQAQNMNLSKMMGNLQTYKDKQKQRDPSNRVNIPYYHKVISRSRHKHAFSATANPESAIMLSKQLPLLERKKKSASPDSLPMQQIQSKVLQVHGEHQCGKQCMDYLEEVLASSDSEDRNTTNGADADNKKLNSVLASKKKKFSKIEKVTFNQRLSQSMVPKTTDINAQQETMLPAISISKKGLNQQAPIVKTRREKPPRQAVLKPHLQPIQKGFDTDGGETDPGHGPSLMNSTDESAGFTVLENGQISLQSKKQSPEVIYSRVSSQTKLQSLSSILRVDDKGNRVYMEGEMPKNRFASNSKTIKANFNSDLIRVAADKVHNLEIASVGSHDSMMSNGERVQHLLRSVEKKRSSTNLVQSVLQVKHTPKLRDKSKNVLFESHESPVTMSARISETNI